MDWKLIVAIYAAVVSTFVASWRIFEFVDEKKGRIRIKIIGVVKGAITKFYDEWDKESTVTALLTNIGRRTRHVKLPYFNVYPSMLIEEHNTITLENLNHPFTPRLLEPGEELRYDIPIWLLVKYRNAGAKKVRVEIADTHGKLYKSKWVPL